MRRRKIRPATPMTDDARDRIAAARARKEEAELERRLALVDATPPSTWRRTALDRYVAEVLSRAGQDRLDFLEENQVSEVFR